MTTTKGRIFLATAITLADADISRLLPPPRPVDPEPLTRPCDRRTLGRFAYHRVRMECP